MSGKIPGADQHALQGSKWTELRTRIEPEDEIVETKKRLSIFHPTDLDFLLRNMGVRAVVFNGGFTDCCILNAAFDASNLDYRVVVAQKSSTRNKCGNGGCSAEDDVVAHGPGHGFE